MTGVAFNSLKDIEKDSFISRALQIDEVQNRANTYSFLELGNSFIKAVMGKDYS